MIFKVAVIKKTNILHKSQDKGGEKLDFNL